MLACDVLERIAQLKIVTKRLMEGPLVGDVLTARHGYGVEFHQIRDYYVGDDVRFIDWKSSARLARLLVKECLEERNRRIIIALDVSASSCYGSTQTKIAWMKDVAAIVAFAGHYAKDMVGLVLFSDVIEMELVPQVTEAALQCLVHTLYEHQVTWGTRTDITVVLNHIAQRWSKDALVFVISDFIAESFGDALHALARIDLVAVRCIDRYEQSCPLTGLLVEDIETGQRVILDDTKRVSQELVQRMAEQNVLFASAGIEVVNVCADDDLCGQLITFFKRRLLARGA